jgi:hypothetical protein
MADTSLGEVAVFTRHAPSYEETPDVPAPIYLGPPIRERLASAAGRTLLRPAATAAAMRGGARPEDVLSFHLWLETARSLGINKVLRPDGSESPLTACLPQVIMPPAAKTSAVSLAMMVQDEEPRIGTALASVAGWVQEMVIVDGGSRDATREIAASFGAQVIDRPFDGDFAQQRNVGLRAIRTPWVLILDADETLSPELPAILDHVAGSGHVDGVFIHLLNRLDEEASPWFWPDRHLRFFRSGHLMTGRIHERITGFRRLAYLPLSGPFILHHKTLAQQWDREKQYYEIDPTYYSSQDAERIKRWGSDPGADPVPGGH